MSVFNLDPNLKIGQSPVTPDYLVTSFLFMSFPTLKDPNSKHECEHNSSMNSMAAAAAVTGEGGAALMYRQY